MKRIIAIFTVCIIVLSTVLPVSAANGKVSYSGNAGEFIFAPGSEYSVTDLFPNFKDVMPGDNLTQQITVKNDANNKVKVKIYMRSLGAHENSKEFLSKLRLVVQKSPGNKMANMFEASADKTAGLTDWVCLGTLYSGGEVNLDVSLNVPVELDNMFQNYVGYLDWEFKVEEFPVEPSDPKPPETGDDSNLELWFALMFGSAAVLILLVILRKKETEKE